MRHPIVPPPRDVANLATFYETIMEEIPKWLIEARGNDVIQPEVAGENVQDHALV